MAHHGQRAALRLEDGAGGALPQRAGRRARAARLRNREDPRRRAVRDCRGPARDRGGVFHAARRDRGGDGGPGAGHDGGEPASRPARGADDARGQARGRPGRTARDVGEAGCRARLRREGARRLGDGTPRGGEGARDASRQRRRRCHAREAPPAALRGLQRKASRNQPPAPAGPQGRTAPGRPLRTMREQGKGPHDLLRPGARAPHGASPGSSGANSRQSNATASNAAMSMPGSGASMVRL